MLPGNMNYLLEIQKLTVKRGGIGALESVDLIVPSKGFISVIGSNGAGKSTLLDTIVGINKKSDGTIHFAGEEISSCKPHEIVEKGVILISEGRQLFRGMTVIDNLLVAGSTARAKENVQDNLDWIFSLFPILKSRRRQVAMTLSGGELQMLAIGCGLMGNPVLLMMDEPSIGIAPMLVSSIFEKIISLKKMGVSLLLVEQNVRLSLEVSEFAYVLENGQIVLKGDAHSLRDNPHVKEAYLGI